MSRICGICGSPAEDASTFECPEMMFGTRELFTYFLCAECGCLQIADVPSDLSPYYPAGYYSSEVESAGRVFLKGRRLRFDLGERSWIGSIISKRYGPDSCAKAIRLGRIGRGDGILDLGGGAGSHLRPLRSAGFRNLLCIDPFVQKESRDRGMEIRRASLDDVEGQYRLIMMHHSFEHMVNPHRVLTAVHRTLTDDGLLLVRIPVLGYGWRQYGVNWMELDPPRHLYLHSRRSFELLASAHGFDVVDVTFDSTEMEIWGSEQYVNGIAHMSPKSYVASRASSLFSPEDIRKFRQTIHELNERGESGRAAFILRKRWDHGSAG